MDSESAKKASSKLLAPAALEPSTISPEPASERSTIEVMFPALTSSVSFAPVSGSTADHLPFFPNWYHWSFFPLYSKVSLPLKAETVTNLLRGLVTFLSFVLDSVRYFSWSAR